ncbi:hypothetical protein CAPTEDRAFT_188908 [Capitella teleta]|uniref:Uncharacterized protein n=1 Tax=Capitella teleta TaxID=283909 RepID=R7VIR7_CAPTE|nr:hypothetical protein CAPTEDRAFT_188908 [Capitella teleta]|eukprot:ELU18452.1 hypothetical protein CAPTEDRAFT_188908 [Capitella teleta]
MALNFDPKFEDWLDQKLKKIKSFASGRSSADTNAAITHSDGYGSEDWDMESVVSDGDGRLPLRKSSEQGDYYQLMWNEENAELDSNSARPSARERVAKILRETELKSSANKEYTTPYEDEPEMPETRHDVMENGYVKFGRLSSSARDEMYDDWEYDDEFNVDRDPTSGPDHHPPPQTDDLQIRFRKFKTDLDEMEAGEFIMDEEYRDSGAFSASVEDPPLRKNQPSLPMDNFDFASSSEDENILDVERDREMMVNVSDTAPIVTLDQGELTANWAKKRHRMMIGVMTVSVLTGVGAFVAIIYFTIHFLSGV